MVKRQWAYKGNGPFELTGLDCGQNRDRLNRSRDFRKTGPAREQTTETETD